MKSHTLNLLRHAWLALPLSLLAGCQSLYYDSLEQFGIQKRHILVDRVEEGRDAQAAAQEQFKDAMTSFRELIEFDGGELEQVYKRLSASYENSEKRVKKVGDRIGAIEDVGQDLFDEWGQEIAEIQSGDLRRRSETMMESTRDDYVDMVAAMKRAESKMHPVLGKLKDNVLFLKHNLNAQMIGSLEGELASIESEVADLIRDMQESIAEADGFIETMQGQQG